MAQLDQQFIFGKGRSISLAQRFPAVYCSNNLNNIFTIRESAEICSALACKRFSLSHEREYWNGAMIGAVFTRPEQRGKGLASLLLRQTVESLRDGGADFAVLWTNQPEFYARLGWLSADTSVAGELVDAPCATPPPGEVASMPAYAADIERIERIRQRWCAGLTARRSDDYCQLPPPAQAVELLLWGEGSEHTAYALVGNTGELGILYELIGHPDGFPALWSRICQGYRRIFVNDALGSASYRWLVQNTGLLWQDKPLTMWLPLSARTEMVRIANWHIAYFDRI